MADIPDQIRFDFSRFDPKSTDAQIVLFPLGTVRDQNGTRYTLELEAGLAPFSHDITIGLRGHPSSPQARNTSFLARHDRARPGTWIIFHRMLDPDLRGLPEDIASAMFDALEGLVVRVARAEGKRPRIRLDVSNPRLLLKCISRGYGIMPDNALGMKEYERSRAFVDEIRSGHRLEESWFICPAHATGSRFLLVNSRFQNRGREPAIVDKSHPDYHPEQFRVLSGGIAVADDPSLASRIDNTEYPLPMVLNASLEKLL